MKFKKYLLIGGAIALVIFLGAVGAIYAVLRFGVLPLHDGTTLGDGSVTTVVSGTFGPIAIGAYTVTLADGGVALIDAGMDENGTAIRNALARMGKVPADVRAIFFTHGHNDHVTGALAFPAAATYVMEPDVAQVKGKRGSDGRGIGVIRPLRDGERLDISGTSVDVFGVPGHTAGSAAFLVPRRLIPWRQRCRHQRGDATTEHHAVRRRRTDRAVAPFAGRTSYAPACRHPPHRVRTSRSRRATRSAIELGVDTVALDVLKAENPCM